MLLLYFYSLGQHLPGPEPNLYIPQHPPGLLVNLAKVRICPVIPFFPQPHHHHYTALLPHGPPPPLPPPGTVIDTPTRHGIPFLVHLHPLVLRPPVLALQLSPSTLTTSPWLHSLTPIFLPNSKSTNHASWHLFLNFLSPSLTPLHVP